MTKKNEAIESFLNAPDDSAEHEEAEQALGDILDDEEQNLSPAILKLRAELEAKNAELAGMRKQEQERMEFWKGGNWQSMPATTQFWLTINKEYASPLKGHFPVTVGNAEHVDHYDFQKGQPIKVRKEVVNVISRATHVGKYWGPDASGNKVELTVNEPRFDYNVIPAWD